MKPQYKLMQKVTTEKSTHWRGISSWFISREEAFKIYDLVRKNDPEANFKIVCLSTEAETS